MSLETTVRNFYGPENLGLPVKHYVTQADQTVAIGEFCLRRETGGREGLELDQAGVQANIIEATRSLRVLKSGDSSFEVAMVGEGPLLLHISTYSSAISTNKGNLYEFAAAAQRYPEYAHLYVGSFGNGGTSPLTDHDDEARYFRKTGRFTREDSAGLVKPIYSVARLHEALVTAGLDVDMLFGTDSAGGSYAKGLALAMESGHLKSAFFSENTGFVNLSLAGIAHGMIVREGKNGSRNAKLAKHLDPEAMNKAKIELATELYEASLSDASRQMLADSRVGKVATVASMLRMVNGLRRGPHDGQHPLLADTNAMLAQHPDAKVVFGVAENDPLYLSPMNAHIAVHSFMDQVAVQNAPVEAMVLPDMSHAYHTHFPAVYHALMKRALDL